MSKALKKDGKKNMIEVLENVKKIIEKMQELNKLAEENAKKFLPEMVRLNRLNELNEKKECYKNNNIYKSINKILYQYYIFFERSDGSIGVSLNSEVFLRGNGITTKIKELIMGNSQFDEIEDILNEIELKREVFQENIRKLKRIKSRNEHCELEELFDYIGTLTFDNECSMTRFNKIINQKIRELSN